MVHPLIIQQANIYSFLVPKMFCEVFLYFFKDAEEKLGFTPYLYGSYNGDLECAFCELADESGVKKCRFFPALDDVPNNLGIIKMWLIEEAE